MSTRRVTLGIDFEFRPKSYWGTELVRRAKQLGTYDGITIDEATARKSFFGLKPLLRSGVDLPPLRPTEVEIARLRLAETIQQEVTSIRARRVGGRIAYRIRSSLSCVPFCATSARDVNPTVSATPQTPTRANAEIHCMW